jgi:hypothetical protein
LKETPGLPRLRHLDDVIVELHVHGENVFQAAARAAEVSDADTQHPAFFAEVSKGRVPLRSGGNAPLGALDAAGVASICEFELECADYEALLTPVDEPKVPPEPRVTCERLWPVLREAGLRIGSDSTPAGGRGDFTSRAAIAEQTGLERRMIDRICSDSQKTVAVDVAITLLMHLGYDERARELEELLDPWLAEIAESSFARYEAFEAMAGFASAARWQPGLTDSELRALSDICWMSVASQRTSFLGTNPDARLTDVRERFQTVHERKPTPLSRRLRREAHAMFQASGNRRRAGGTRATQAPPRPRGRHHYLSGAHAHTPAPSCRTTAAEEQADPLSPREARTPSAR